MNKQLAQIHLCPWELIDLDTSNLEFVVVFFNADTVEKKSKQEFKIQHVQSDELPNILLTYVHSVYINIVAH